MTGKATRMLSLLQRRPLLIAVPAICLGLVVLPLRAQQPITAIRAGAMVDVERGRLIKDAVIVVQSGRIVAAGSRTDVRVPSNASSIDLPATTLVPGLIDAHVHLTR